MDRTRRPSARRCLIESVVRDRPSVASGICRDTRARYRGAKEVKDVIVVDDDAAIADGGGSERSKPKMALLGRVAPAGPMLLLEIVLLSFPLAVTASVLNRMVPAVTETAPVAEPRIFALVTVLPVAPLMKRIVLVPADGGARVRNDQRIPAAIEAVDGHTVRAIQIDQWCRQRAAHCSRADGRDGEGRPRADRRLVQDRRRRLDRVAINGDCDGIAALGSESR